MNAATKSWKTTAAAICGVLSAVLLNVQHMLDADPATVADWASVVPIAIAAGGLIFARDNDVSSASAGAE